MQTPVTTRAARLLIVFAFGCSSPSALRAATPPPPPRAIDYQAHRGGRGLRPENTIDAFAHALELDVDTLEMDVMLTADDVLVVHHDERLDPNITRDATGAWLDATGPAVRSLPLVELERYDVGWIRPATPYAARFPDQVGRDGVRIPTLAQVIELAEKQSHQRIRYNLEIKTTPSRPTDTAPPEIVADHLVAAVRASGIAGRTTIQSFDWRSLRRVHAIAPEVPLSCLTSAETIEAGAAGASPWTAGLDVDAFARSVPRLVHAFGCQIWSPDEKMLTRPQVDEAHGLGVSVVPWTVNAPDAMARLIEWDVDGIITDFPDRLPKRR